MSVKKSKTVIFDTSVWIAFFLDSDFFHFNSVRKVGVYEKRSLLFYIPITVLIEIITVLSNRGIDINQIRKIVKTFSNTENYLIQTIGSEELIELSLQHSTRVKLKALDYHIYLYYIKLRPTNFESYDDNLRNSINIFKNERLN